MKTDQDFYGCKTIDQIKMIKGLWEKQAINEDCSIKRWHQMNERFNRRMVGDSAPPMRYKPSLTGV